MQIYPVRHTPNKASAWISAIVYAAILSLIATRSVLDPVLSLTQGNTGRLGNEAAGQGLGALINALVIALGSVILIGTLRNRVTVGVTIIWTPFFVTILYGLALSPYPFGALRTAAGFLSYFYMLLAGMVFTRNYRDVERNIRMVIFSSLIPLIYSIAEIATHNTIIEGQQRLQSTFPHPNIYAFYLNIIICCIMFCFYAVPRLNVVSAGILRLVLIGCLAEMLGTQSRSGWIACSFMLMSFTLLKAKKLFAVVLATIAGVLLIPAVQDRILTSLSGGNEYAGWETKLNSYAWRKLLWGSAIDDINDNWVFGQGLDAFRANSPKFFLLLEGIPTDAHNAYIQLLYDVGMVGLFSFLLIFVSILIAVYRSPSHQSSGKIVITLMITTYLFCSYSDNVLYYLVFNWYFWFTVGVMLSALRMGYCSGTAPRRCCSADGMFSLPTDSAGNCDATKVINRASPTTNGRPQQMRASR